MSIKDNTIVVPVKAQKEKEIKIKPFWFGVTVSKERLKHLQYIAFYQNAPASRILYYAKLTKQPEMHDSDNAKYKFYMDNLMELKSPVVYDKTKKDAIIRSRRYTTFDRLKNAKFLRDLF